MSDDDAVTPLGAYAEASARINAVFDRHGITSHTLRDVAIDSMAHACARMPVIPEDLAETICTAVAAGRLRGADERMAAVMAAHAPSPGDQALEEQKG